MNVNQVSGLLLHLHVHLHVIAAAREVLIDEELPRVLEHVAVENLAAGEAHVAQRLHEVFCLDLLVARKIEGADGGPFLHHYHQGRFISAKLDVTKEAGVIERAQGLAESAAYRSGRRC